MKTAKPGLYLVSLLMLACLVGAHAYLSYLHNSQAEAVLSSQQLNIQFLDRISRLRLVELDLRRRTDRGERIYAKNENHPPFAGEEIDITLQWHAALRQSKEFEMLPDSLQTIVNDMAPPLAELDASFGKIQKTAPSRTQDRRTILDKEITPEVSSLISQCENAMTQNSQSGAILTARLRQSGSYARILSAASIGVFLLIVAAAAGLRRKSPAFPFRR